MIPVLVLTRNCLELTIPCIASVQGQNYPTLPFVFDNGSTDGTIEWLKYQRISGLGSPDNKGVSVGWNLGLTELFKHFPKVLVLNNDAILPAWFVRELLSYEEEFITGVATHEMPADIPPARHPLAPHPDFSAFLISKSVWERVGKFDESTAIYCGDCDYHIRAHQLGVNLWKANAPYYHVNSQTVKRASDADRAVIAERASMDRANFRKKWGCLPGSDEYNAIFTQSVSV